MQERTIPPHIILFTGHMIDTDARKTPRFPPESEGMARAMIQQAVEKIARIAGEAGKKPFGLSGGASGGDILFQEVCNALGIKSKLCLALPADRYVALSVAPADKNWVNRFNRLTKNNETLILPNNNNLKDRGNNKDELSVWERANLWMLDKATELAGEDFTLVALWNGDEGDGPGGTKDMVARARTKGAGVIHLDAKLLLN